MTNQVYHVYALIIQEPTFDTRKMTPNPDAVVEIYNKDGLLLFQTSSLEDEEDIIKMDVAREVHVPESFVDVTFIDSLEEIPERL